MTHYLFGGWPDQGVPSFVNDLLGFMFRIRRESRDCKAPLIVHCRYACLAYTL